MGTLPGEAGRDLLGRDAVATAQRVRSPARTRVAEPEIRRSARGRLTTYQLVGMLRLMTQARPTARTKLLDAALRLIRTKGYAATAIDDLCHAAGVTKGAFFHHFRSKEELAVAA